ncbi:MATE family efflux transporter [Anaerostipes caccae]|uniref:MATE family efflux transporter n=1 Tax=Anaerostipes caccae TaxID=105841 RepID=UPI00101CC67B|nr:MATE family efflux transporter [Anaerostipes caccae]
MALVIPMALQNLINTGVSACDVFMLGKVGETALSASSLARQVQYIMSLFLFGLTSGATVLTAQYWGKGDKKTIERILAMGMCMAVAVTAIFTLVSLLMPETLIRIFTNESEVIREGVKYLRIVAFSYIAIGITDVYLYIMRSVERIKVATAVYLSSLICNVILNAVFIFGMFGCPAMGIRGAALATLLARILELILVIGYAKIYNREILFRMKYFFHMDSGLLKDFLVCAVPVILNEVLWGIANSASTAILGHMGSAAVAANSVAQVTKEMSMVVSFGISNAAAIYLGKTIGEKKYQHARAYAERFVKLSILLGIGSAVIILLSSQMILTVMAMTPLTKDYLRFMMCVMAYYAVAQTLDETVIVGIFRSGGDTRFGLIIDLTAMWGCSVLLGAAAAFVFHCSAPVVYALLMSDELVKIPIIWGRYKNCSWIRNITREIE